MEWWQILVVGMGFLGTAAALTYGVLVAVVREKERIYRRWQASERERAQLELALISADEKTCQTELPGLLVTMGVRINATGLSAGRSLIVLRVKTQEIKWTNAPSDQEIAENWFEKWYAQTGCHESFQRLSGYGWIHPTMAGHKLESRNHAPQPSSEDWQQLTTKLTTVGTKKIFIVTLAVFGQLLLEKRCADLREAAAEIRNVLLSLEPEMPVFWNEQDQDKARMMAEAEEGGEVEVVKLKRG